MAAPDVNHPAVAVVHQMARTGGTLVNRSLGSMRHVLVLSGVHPLDPQRKVTRQAATWFQLLSEGDLPWLQDISTRDPITAFAEIVVRLGERSATQGRHLVLRDWSHLDFLGVPFVRDPPMRLLTEEALKDRCELSQAFVVRHPLDQFASSASRPGMAPHLTPARFLEAYLAFARIAADRGFQRYEDLVADPHRQLGELCRSLRLPFDPGYGERWQSYDKLTGDSAGPSRGFSRQEIAPMPALPLDDITRQALEREPVYRDCLDPLGYAARPD
jgi:protein O-GlcNAc transferase